MLSKKRRRGADGQNTRMRGNMRTEVGSPVVGFCRCPEGPVFVIVVVVVVMLAPEISFNDAPFLLFPRVLGNIERVALAVAKSVDDRPRYATFFLDLLFERLRLALVLADEPLLHDQQSAFAGGD